MSRLDRLEAGVASLNRSMVQVSEILLDQNQRIDHLGERIDQLGSRLENRLDRLIELQTRGLTEWVERQKSHEQRITRLEQRVDRLEK
jgi:hypothetical protein